MLLKMVTPPGSRVMHLTHPWSSTTPDMAIEMYAAPGTTTTWCRTWSPRKGRFGTLKVDMKICSSMPETGMCMPSSGVIGLEWPPGSPTPEPPEPPLTSTQ